MEGYRTASTPSPVSYQEEEETSRMESTTPNCSLIDNEHSTLIPETDDSMYVNTGYTGDSEVTLSQTPAPIRDYANAVVTGSYVSMSQTPGPAYRLRSMTRELTKPRFILKELIDIVKEDIREDEKSIKERKEREDEVYTLLRR